MNVLERQLAKSTSLTTANTTLGTRDTSAASAKIASLDSGTFVDCLTRSGIGRDGEVTSIEGTASSSVNAFKDMMYGSKEYSDCSSVRSWPGKEAKIISGNVRRAAMATEISERGINECDIGLLAVVTEGMPAFKEAYRGRVVDDVNAKAMVVIPCQREPILVQPGFVFNVPLCCVIATSMNQRM